MKKTLIILLLFICSESVTAQDEKKAPARRYQAGLITGINISNFDTRIGEFGAGQSSTYDEYVRISTMAGFHNRYHFSKVFSLEAEVLFNARGGSYRTDQTGVSSIGTSKPYFYKNYRLNYLDIPLIAEFDITPNRPKHSLHVSLGGGVSYALLLSSTLRYNGFSPTGTTTGPFSNVSESYSVMSFDYGKSSLINYIVDVNFDFKNGKKLPLFIKLRYQMSSGTVYNQSQLNGDNLNTKMNTFCTAFGFYFKK